MAILLNLVNLDQHFAERWQMIGANGWTTVGPMSKTTLVQRWRATLSQSNYIPTLGQRWPTISTFAGRADVVTG